MGGSSLTIEKVVATVRERGPLANREICAVLGVAGEEQARALDRLLQKARKSGLLRCSGGRWVALTPSGRPCGYEPVEEVKP